MHCYRMLGSVQDAEDALQDTLLAAWQGFDGFEGRASVRTWLYRIATNRCLNARRSAGRRPAKEWNVPDVEPPEPTRLGEVVWLEPYPRRPARGRDRRAARPGGAVRADRVHLAGVRDRAAGAAAAPARRPRPARRARIPRQRGGRHAGHDRRVGHQRAQAGPRRPAARGRRPRTAAPAAGSPAEDAIVARFVRAYESADLDALVALLTDDVFISMPPMPFEYEGRDARGPLLRQPLPAPAGGSTSCRPGPTASRRSAPTCAPRPASATGPASSCSPSPATGSPR